MCARVLPALALLLALLVGAAPARAWVETTVVSGLATLDLERDGSALVTHELALRVRGGPLTQLVIDGVDLDAEPESDGVVQPARGDGTPIPLLLARSDEGNLKIEIDHPKGLRSGTYLLRFRYRTRLLERELIRVDGDGVEVRWVGPRFADGIDSVKALFRVPAAAVPPRLLDADGEVSGGVFLSNVRRGADRDELEIVRPHVAKGEPVVWRVWASARAFDAFKPPADGAAGPALPEPRDHDPMRRLLVLLGAALAALLYAGLVGFKTRAHAAACQLRSAAPRSLVPLSTSLRAAGAGLLLGGAVVVALLGERPTLAALLLLGAALLAALRAPELRPALRGPGSWLPLTENDAFARPRAATLPGRWLDLGCWQGRLAALLTAALVAVIAAWIGRRHAYFGCLLGLGASVLLPIFLTGCSRELPPAPESSASLLGWMARAIRARSGCKVLPLVRIPSGARDPDELRLLIVPKVRVAGLVAVEVCVELQHGWGGSLPVPCVLVRAREGSRAHESLPRRAVWSRGRKPEERASLLRPALPARHECVALVLEVLEALKPVENQPESSRRMSSGSGSCSVNPGRRAVPRQASALA